MTADQKLALDGKIVCGPGGSPVTITALTVGDGMKEGQLKIEFSGMATDYLINPQNSNGGSEPLPEPVFVSEGFDLEEVDKQKTYNRWNKNFKIDPPLTDTEEEINRFGEGAEDSVYPAIVGAGAYFRLTVKPPTNPKFEPTIYTNLHTVPVKNPATADTIKAALDKIAAKKAAQKAEEEKKAKEFEDAFS